jgi:hypothetical protein
MERAPCFYVGAIVTNPPYKLADQFVEHALTLCPRVIMLLRLAFLESRRRSDLIDGWLTGAGSCFPKPAANDAPARLARTARIQFDSFCLVRLGSRLSRQD